MGQLLSPSLLSGTFYNSVLTDVTALRAAGIIYTNTTLKPKFVLVNVKGVIAGTVDCYLTDSTGVPVYSGNAVYTNASLGNSHYVIANMIVMPGQTYQLVITFGTLFSWFEL